MVSSESGMVNKLAERFLRGLTSDRSLDTWQTYFGFPEGPLLGFFNCVQPVGQIVSFPIEAWISDRFGRRFGMICGASIILGMPSP